MTAKIVRSLMAVLAVSLLIPCTVSAQGGGASSTGTIQGRVADASGAILPGVTVTAVSPSMIGAQTQITNENGTYRFPAVPPGVYSLTFELSGFSTVKRDGIQISLGFTANVNADLALATLQETVTVSGASPVIDTTATRVQQNFKLEQLDSIPNGRDMWALLAATPGVVMSRIDVGGNRAGTQTGYTRVRPERPGARVGGRHQHHRGHRRRRLLLRLRLVRGSVPRRGRPGRRGGDPRRAVAVPRQVGQQQVLGRVLLRTSTTTRSRPRTCRTSSWPPGLRPGSNEVEKYYDTNVNFGGPIKKDKAWFHVAWRKQFNAVQQPLFTFDKTFDTWNTNPSAKVTYQVNQSNKLIGYYQWNMKVQPNRLPLGGYTYTDPGQTVAPGITELGLQGRVERHAQRQALRRGPLRRLRLLRSAPLANSDEEYFWRDSGRLLLTGAHAQSQTDRDRKQFTGAATYFLDTKSGSHTIKFGGEIYRETQWGGRAAERRRQHRAHLLQRRLELGGVRRADGRSRSAAARRATMATCWWSTSSISRTSSSTTRGRWAA